MRGNYFRYMVVKVLWPLITMLLYTINSSAVTTYQHSWSITSNYIDASLKDAHLLQNALPQDELGFYLFSHGRPGELFINDKWLGAEEIATFVKTHFSFPFAEMSAGQGSLNIYGCYFAQGEKGRAAVTYLEKELDIQVAASTNLTGASGDWVLEMGVNASPLEVKNYAFNLQSTITSVSTQLASTGNIAVLNDGNLNQQNFYLNNQNYPGTNREIFNISFNQAAIITQFRFLLDTSDGPNNSFFNAGTQYRVEGFDGTTYTVLTGTITASGTVTAEEEVINLSGNTTAYVGYRILWVGGDPINRNHNRPMRPCCFRKPRYRWRRCI